MANEPQAKGERERQERRQGAREAPVRAGAEGLGVAGLAWPDPSDSAAGAAPRRGSLVGVPVLRLGHDAPLDVPAAR
eukprot:5327993-Alexandrium_andersonii.AAC.1